MGDCTLSLEYFQRSIGGNSLVQDYLNDQAPAATFYRGSPSSAETFRAKAKEVSAAFDATQKGASFDLLRPAGPTAEAALARVREGAGFLITTGQQPGLFGGPLYSLYKGLTAIRLAEAAEQALGVPVMAVFWIASEDHDWEEANHSNLLNRDNEVQRISLGERPSEAALPLSSLAVESSLGEAIGNLDELLAPSEFKAGVFENIRQVLDSSTTLPSAFEALLKTLLSDLPIAFVSASDEGLKRASVPTLRSELATSDDSERILNETTAELENADFGTQVAVMPGGVNLFVETEAGRERLYRDGNGGFLTKGSAQQFSAGDLNTILDTDPGRLSPNVLLRPVVESSVFPTLAYVGGPGEIAYFGQLKAFFEHHKIGMPIVVPRASLLLVETKIRKVIEKFGVDIDDLQDIDALITHRAKGDLPSEVRRLLGEWRGTAGRLGGELTKAVVQIDSTLKGSVNNTKNAALSAIQDLEKKIVQGVKKANEISTAQLRKAHTNLWPNGKPQDRILGPVPYVTRYGPGFVDGAYSAIQV